MRVRTSGDAIPPPDRDAERGQQRESLRAEKTVKTRKTRREWWSVGGGLGREREGVQACLRRFRTFGALGRISRCIPRRLAQRVPMRPHVVESVSRTRGWGANNSAVLEEDAIFDVEFLPWWRRGSQVAARLTPARLRTLSWRLSSSEGVSHHPNIGEKHEPLHTLMRMGGSE